MFQSKTMRRIQLQSNSRRKRRPLRIGLFIVYVLVQYITCAKIPEELTSTYPSSTDREENWTVESTLESFTTTVEETIIKEPLSVESVAKEIDEKNEGKSKEEEVGSEKQEQKGKEEKIKEEEKSKEAHEKSKEELVGKAVVPKKEVTTILSKNVPRTTTVRL